MRQRCTRCARPRALRSVRTHTPSTAPLGAWLEQLVAESTGKNGKAIVPVDLERPGAASVYGDDHFSRYIPGGPVTVRYDFNLFSRFPNMQPVGMYPIHIIVKNLRTTLLGTVDTDLDRTIASTRARTVPGVLNVDVEVMVARDLARK